MKIHEKSNKNISIYYTGYVTIKNSKYLKIYGASPLYLISKKVNGYFEEINGNKYLTLVPTSESKAKIYGELLIKIRYLMRLLTKISNSYDEKYIKMKLSSDDELPLNKTIETPTMAIIVRVVSDENNKYYPQFF